MDAFPASACRTVCSPFLLNLVIGLSVLLLGVHGLAGKASAAGYTEDQLFELNLEELVSLEVTSVAKKPQKISDSSAAIFVISQEDIRRSGVTSIPEALRLAPGLNVARIDGNKWAITSRGFNGRFANKLLVLIDGRSVYTPLFSGVYWDVQDTLLDDIERIEVIRGPGAALWGANAVNGVINVITKSTEKTHGVLTKAGYGTEEQGFGAVRFGSSIGNRFDYRAYAKYFNRDAFDALDGGQAADDWRAFRGGFRIDGRLSPGNRLTVQGDAYSGTEGQTDQILAPDPVRGFRTIADNDTDFSGGNLLLRWERTLSPTSDLVFQTYYDRTDRDEPALVKESRDTFDVDLQHRFALGEHQEIIWGLGYRITVDDLEVQLPTEADPASKTDQLFSLFVQDEITLSKDLLRLTLGAKFEHNDYTGLEIQPNARLIWTPGAKHSIWAAVSRAVRTPSRAGAGGTLWMGVKPSSPPTVLIAVGNDDFDAEELIAWEIGYRFAPTRRFSLDCAAFLNDFDNLRSTEPRAPDLITDPAPYYAITSLFDNNTKAKTYGVEIVADWKLYDWWRLQGTYSFLEVDGDPTDDSRDANSVKLMQGATPQHQLSLRSSLDLPNAVELDCWLRYTDRLEALGVDDYLTLDLRLGWHPTPELEIALVAQNLLEKKHQEYVPEFQTLATEVPRGFYGQVVWRY